MSGSGTPRCSDSQLGERQQWAEAVWKLKCPVVFETWARVLSGSSRNCFFANSNLFRAAFCGPEALSDERSAWNKPSQAKISFTSSLAPIMFITRLML